MSSPRAAGATAVSLDSSEKAAFAPLLTMP
jgi:hypothetical protein